MYKYVKQVDQILPFVDIPGNLVNETRGYPVPGCHHYELVRGEVPEPPGCVAEEMGLEEEVELVGDHLPPEALDYPEVGELPHRCVDVHVALGVQERGDSRMEPLLVQALQLHLCCLLILAESRPHLAVNHVPSLAYHQDDDLPAPGRLPSLSGLAEVEHLGKRAVMRILALLPQAIEFSGGHGHVIVLQDIQTEFGYRNL